LKRSNDLELRLLAKLSLKSSQRSYRSALHRAIY